MMKKIASVALAALVGTLLCGCGIRISGLNISAGYTYPDSEKYSVGGGEIAGGVSALDIDWISGAVDIVSYDGDAVRFTEDSDKSISRDLAMRYWLDKGRLHIRFCKSGTANIINLDKTLTVWLPTGNMPEEIELAATSAEVKAEGLDVNSACFDTVSGSVTVSRSSFGVELDVDTTSGEVDITDCVFPEGDMDSVSGDITLTGCSIKHELETDTTSGKVEVELSEHIRCLKADTVSGSVRITCDSVGEFEANTTSGDVKAHFSKQPDQCSIDTTSGKVELGLPKDADCRIEFETISGKLKCELPAETDGDGYIIGRGTARYTIDTTSGGAKIVRVG